MGEKIGAGLIRRMCRGGPARLRAHKGASKLADPRAPGLDWRRGALAAFFWKPDPASLRS